MFLFINPKKIHAQGKQPPSAETSSVPLATALDLFTKRISSTSLSSNLLDRMDFKQQVLQQWDDIVAIADQKHATLVNLRQDLVARHFDQLAKQQEQRILEHDQIVASLTAQVQSFVRAIDINDVTAEQARKKILEVLQRSDAQKPSSANPTLQLPNRLVKSTHPIQTLLALPETTKPVISTGVRRGIADLPQPEDLQATDETTITPEIHVLARQLGYDPLAIYTYVHNTIMFDPYYGSHKGATLTLLERRGNDIDTASLLIALLRASHYPVRYASGTIVLDEVRARNWAGNAPDLETAAQIFQTGGYTVAISADRMLTLNYVWAEMYPSATWRSLLPFILGGRTQLTDPHVQLQSASNGASEGAQWVALAPSFKQFTFHEPMDMSTITGANAAQWISEIRAATRINDAERAVLEAPHLPSNDRPQDKDADRDFMDVKIEAANNAFQQYLTAHPEKTTIDLFGGATIVNSNTSALPTELPIALSLSQPVTRFAQLSDSLRAFLEIEVYNRNGTLNTSYRASLAQLATQRVTISYIAATPQDQQVIDSYGGSLLTTPPVINLIPVIKVNGVDQAHGTPAGMGTFQWWSQTFSDAGQPSFSIGNWMPVGSITNVALDYGHTSGDTIEIAQQRLREAVNRLPKDSDGAPDVNAPQNMSEPLVGETLHIILQSYFNQTDMFAEMLARYRGVRWFRALSGGVGMQRMIFDYSFGEIPTQTLGTGLGMDIGANNAVAVSLRGQPDDVLTWFRAWGDFGSALEHSSFENQGFASLSTIRLLNTALRRGMPVYRIDATTRATIFPRLQMPQYVLDDITRFLNAGYIVTVHERELKINDWQGVGLIVTNPTTGGFGYLIYGGLGIQGQVLAGGSIDKILWKVQAVSWAIWNVWKDEAKIMSGVGLMAVPEPFSKVVGIALIVDSSVALWQHVPDLVNVTLGNTDPKLYVREQASSAMADAILGHLGGKAAKYVTENADPATIQRYVKQVDKYTNGAASTLIDSGVNAVDTARHSLQEANPEAWEQLQDLAKDKAIEKAKELAKELVNNEHTTEEHKASFVIRVVKGAPAAPGVAPVQQDAAQRGDFSGAYDLQRAEADQATPQQESVAAVGNLITLYRPTANVQFRPITGFTQSGAPILGNFTTQALEADFAINGTIWVDAKNTPLIGRDLRIWNQVQKGQAAIQASLITSFRIECAGPVDTALIGWAVQNAAGVEIRANLGDGFN